MFNVTWDNDPRPQNLRRVFEKCVVPPVPRIKLSNTRPSILRSSYTCAVLLHKAAHFGNE